MKRPQDIRFYEWASSLVGKDAIEISEALIKAYFDGRDYGFNDAKQLYRQMPSMLGVSE